VKLNVPPPTPGTESVAPPAPEEPTTPQASAQAEPKPAMWPDWFGIADLAMILFVGLAAFLLGSFAARNSDLWLHLGVGRLVASGDFVFGNDPLSFSGADRVWVNHSWLYDLVTYQLLKLNATGAALVAAKACMFVLALGLVFAIRRPGHALWPWAVFGALAALAAAPYLTLRPIVVSTPFLAATLYVLFRAEWKPGSWRNPILLAVLFGVWANIDAWFVLGPASVFLVLLGERLQTRVLKGRDDAGAVPLGVPPVAGLAKALILGVIACMLNPHHVRVWEIPAEFGWGFPAEYSADNELRGITLSPLMPQFWESKESVAGTNWHGVCWALLALLSFLLLALELGRLRVAHFFLWLAFFYLALRHSQLILFFTLLVIPLTAGYLNALSAGVTLTTWKNRGTRLLLTGSGVGRLVCLAFAVVMAACAWPGWLHPPASHPALLRRVEWRIETDPGLERAAKQIAAWRDAGLLPADVHGMANTVHFGNYAAWFAPGEKVFVNGRINFHKPEFPDLYALRKALTLGKDRNNAIESSEVARIVDSRHAGYLVVTNPLNRLPEGVVYQLLNEPKDWQLWYIDGRSAVLARVTGVDKETLSRLAFDPVRTALFGEKSILPEGNSNPPSDERTWWDDFVKGVKLPPAPAEDSRIYANLAEHYRTFSEVNRQQKGFLGSALTGVAARIYGPLPPREVSDAERAVALMQLRAARLAVADDPDSSEGYYALFAAYQNPALPELWADSQSGPGERSIQLLSAANRFLARVPPPADCTRENAVRAFEVGSYLVNRYKQLNQFDYALDAMKKVKAYFPYGQGPTLKEAVDLIRGQGEAAAKQAEAQLKAVAEGVDGEEKRLTDFVGEQIGRLDRVSKQGTAVQRYQFALRSGLPGMAIEAFRADSQAFGQEQNAMVFAVIGMELISGRLEQAAQDYRSLAEGVEKLSSPQAEEARDPLRHLEFRMRVLEGNYARAGSLLEQLNGNGRFPKMSDEDKAKLALLLPSFKPEPAAIAVLGGSAQLVFRTLAQQPALPVLAALQAEHQFHHMRGLLFLIEGHFAEARKQFALSSAPQGVTTIPLPWAKVDEQFVRMIDAATTR
jgi:hypothetical protein